MWECQWQSYIWRFCQLQFPLPEPLNHVRMSLSTCRYTYTCKYMGTGWRRLIGSPTNIGHFCGKWPIKIRDPMSLGHPVRGSCICLTYVNAGMLWRMWMLVSKASVLYCLTYVHAGIVHWRVSTQICFEICECKYVLNYIKASVLHWKTYMSAGIFHWRVAIQICFDMCECKYVLNYIQTRGLHWFKYVNAGTGWRRLIGSLIFIGFFHKGDLYLVALL